MHHRFHAHIVWTTRDRVASIDCDRAELLQEQLPIIARQERSRLLALGIVSTHLHMIVRLNPATQLPRMLQRMKGGTAFRINRATGSDFKWAKGYSLTSVSPTNLGRAVRYVTGQASHHPELAIPEFENR